ncbi:MAG: ankyrin repeat domain-containing protein [Nitrospirota bacterium]
MSKVEWTLLHELAYLYHVFVILPTAAQEHEDESHMENRINAIYKKISEWQSHIDHDQVMSEVRQKLGKDIENAKGRTAKMSENLNHSLTNVKEHLPEKNRKAVIADLVHIINSPTPTSPEIDLLKSVSKYLEVDINDFLEGHDQSPDQNGEGDDDEHVNTGKLEMISSFYWQFAFVFYPERLRENDSRNAVINKFVSFLSRHEPSIEQKDVLYICVKSLDSTIDHFKAGKPMEDITAPFDIRKHMPENVKIEILRHLLEFSGESSEKIVDFIASIAVLWEIDSSTLVEDKNSKPKPSVKDKEYRVDKIQGEVGASKGVRRPADGPISHGSFIEDVFQRAKKDIPNLMFANFSETLEKHNKIPCLVLDDGIEAWSVGSGGGLKSIYERADVKLNRAPFYYNDNYLVNGDWKTYVIFHQDGFITMTPGDKTKNPASWDWHFYDDVSLIKHPENGNAVIVLYKDGEISCALESDRDKNGKCIVSNYEVLFAYKIIQRLWPYIMKSETQKVGPTTLYTTSFPMDLFYFIDKKGVKSIAGSGGQIQIDESEDVSEHNVKQPRESIRSDAKVDIRKTKRMNEHDDIDAKDDDDRTALMGAASIRDTENVEILIDNGADIEAKDNNGRTALMWLIYASASDETEALELLLSKGADIEAKDKNGQTALMYAVLQGDTKIAKLLIDKGADIEAKDDDGRTALMLAAEGGYTKIVKLLTDKEAEKSLKENDAKIDVVAGKSVQPDPKELTIKPDNIESEKSEGRVTYNDFAEFKEAQGKYLKKRPFLPVAEAVHNLAVKALDENRLPFEIRFGDGTFSLSVPKEMAKSRTRTFVRFGLLGVKGYSYLESLYKGDDDPLPKGAHYWKKDNLTQYVFDLYSDTSMQEMEDPIRGAIINSYGMLSKTSIPPPKKLTSASDPTSHNVVKKAGPTQSDKSETISLPPQQYNALLYGAGVKAFEKGQFDDAIKVFLSLVEDSELGQKSRVHLALAYHEINEMEKAVATVAPIVKAFDISSSTFMSSKIPKELRSEDYQRALYVSGRIKFEKGLEIGDHKKVTEGIKELFCSYDLNPRTQMAQTVRKYVDMLCKEPAIKNVFSALSELRFDLDGWWADD